jgi:hypothetical protein
MARVLVLGESTCLGNECSGKPGKAQKRAKLPFSTYHQEAGERPLYTLAELKQLGAAIVNAKQERVHRRNALQSILAPERLLLLSPETTLGEVW